MTKWVTNTVFVVLSSLFSVGVLAVAWLLLFVNPFNWKNYGDFAAGDWVWILLSNGLILVTAIGLVTLIWSGLWKVRAKMANKAMQPTPR